MNKWELRHKYMLDKVRAMVEYAYSVAPNQESQEFVDALQYWINEKVSEFKVKWESENGKLEEEEL